jgi:cell division protein FtsB
MTVVACLLVVSAWQRAVIAGQVEGRRLQAEREVSELQARQAALAAEVQYLSNERGIEAEMRRQFDVALPGEQVVVIVEPDIDTATATTETASTTEVVNEPWYRFW